jgi:hypothetical protein
MIRGREVAGTSAAKAELDLEVLRHEWNSYPSRLCMNPESFRGLIKSRSSETIASLEHLWDL